MLEFRVKARVRANVRARDRDSLGTQSAWVRKG